MTDSESDDVAVVVYREDDAWEVDLLPPALTEDLAGLIDLERAWDIQPQAGSSITVAVLDTGVAYTNATLTVNISGFSNGISRTTDSIRTITNCWRPPSAQRAGGLVAFRRAVYAAVRGQSGHRLERARDRAARQ